MFLERENSIQRPGGTHRVLSRLAQLLGRQHYQQRAAWRLSPGQAEGVNFISSTKAVSGLKTG